MHKAVLEKSIKRIFYFKNFVREREEGGGGRRNGTQLASQMERKAPSREEMRALSLLTSEALGYLNNLRCFSQEETTWFCHGEVWMESRLPSGLPVYEISFLLSNNGKAISTSQHSQGGWGSALKTA